MTSRPWSAVIRDRADGSERRAELIGLIEAHAAAGSELAERLAVQGGSRPEDVWLVEPLASPATGAGTGASVDPAPVAIAIRPTRGEVPVAARSARPVAVPTLS